MEKLMQRMIRAAKLDPHLYEEVEADITAIKQAIIVVVLSSVAAGIGTLGTGQNVNILLSTIGALIGWYIWTLLTYWVGTKILPEPETSTSYQEMLRTIGFSSAPGILRIFGIFPPITQLVFVVTGIWMLVAMVIAVRQALDYKNTWRAVGVCLIGWLIQWIFVMLFISLIVGSQASAPAPVAPAAV